MDSDGDCPLETIIKTALESIAKWAYNGLESVTFCAFTPEEQTKLCWVVEDIKNGVEDRVPTCVNTSGYRAT